MEEQELLLEEEAPDREANEPEAIQLRTKRDVTITLQALVSRQDELEKLAKKNKETGYFNEAKAIEHDVTAIKDHILPALREQRELPLVTTDQLRAGIANMLQAHLQGRVFVRPIDDPEDPGGTERLVRNRTAELNEDLAAVIERFAVAVAEDAYARGFAARGHTPEGIALSQISSLSRG